MILIGSCSIGNCSNVECLLKKISIGAVGTGSHFFLESTMFSECNGGRSCILKNTIVNVGRGGGCCCARIGKVMRVSIGWMEW